MTSVGKRFYLPQLDGLRYFAFFLVFIHHFWTPGQYFQGYGIITTVLDKLHAFGWMGVDLFLVLSAFLITNLLLLEQQRTRTISLKDFYIRRTLRIWPLYYFMLLIGFFINPAASGNFLNLEHVELLKNHFMPYMIFLGNFSAGIFGYAESRYLSHLWTISLEEQFYILWPLLLVLLVTRKKLLYAALAALLALSVYLRIYLLMIGAEHPIIWTNIFTRLDALALGCFLAIYRFDVDPDERLDLWKFLGGLLLISMSTCYPNIGEQSVHEVWQYSAVALGFCLILDSSLSASFRPLHVVLANRPIVWLGKLCYGLYVYHLLGLNLGKKLCRKLPLADLPEINYLVTFSVSLLLTILLAWVSYAFMEKRFLKMKNKFTHILSRPE